MIEASRKARRWGGGSGDAKARVAAPRGDARVSAEADAVFGIPVTLTGILVAVLLEKATCRTSRDSGLPPSQTDGDGTARRTRGGANGIRLRRFIA